MQERTASAPRQIAARLVPNVRLRLVARLCRLGTFDVARIVMTVASEDQPEIVPAQLLSFFSLIMRHARDDVLKIRIVAEHLVGIAIKIDI